MPGLIRIFMVSETTSEIRLDKIIAGRGVFYLVSRLGVTGAKKRPLSGYQRFPDIQRLRTGPRYPLPYSFGISSPRRVIILSAAGADAVIVGSAIVARVEEHIGRYREMQDAIGYCVSSMQKATLTQNEK